MRGYYIKYVLVLLAVLVIINLTSCYQAGSLGESGVVYKFDCTRGELQTCMQEVKRSSRSFVVPYKWMRYDDWDKSGYGFLNGVVYHFSNEDLSDERLYYITLVKQESSDTTSTSPSYLAGRAIFLEEDGKPRWKNFEDVTKAERDLADKRISTLMETFKDQCNCSLVE